MKTALFRSALGLTPAFRAHWESLWELGAAERYALIAEAISLATVSTGEARRAIEERINDRFGTRRALSATHVLSWMVGAGDPGDSAADLLDDLTEFDLGTGSTPREDAELFFNALLGEMAERRGEKLRAEYASLVLPQLHSVETSVDLRLVFPPNAEEANGRAAARSVLDAVPLGILELTPTEGDPLRLQLGQDQLSHLLKVLHQLELDLHSAAAYAAGRAPLDRERVGELIEEVQAR